MNVYELHYQEEIGFNNDDKMLWSRCGYQVSIAINM